MSAEKRQRHDKMHLVTALLCVHLLNSGTHKHTKNFVALHVYTSFIDPGETKWFGRAK